MKNFLFSLVLGLISPCIFYGQEYFQQETNFEIQVELIPADKIYVATANMEYINNSPHTLEEIYLHLWSNAYSSNTSAFAKQKLRIGNTDFHFRGDEAGGGYTSFEIEDENAEVEFSNYEENPDIVVLKLNRTLAQGESMNFKMSFTVRVPEFFSRMGQEDGFFQITQWFPKPAVYDNNGWNQMPYLELGEYFSEFGSFKVDITVPADYEVAATGKHEGVKYPEDGKKTFSFAAEKVHDFAFVAFDDFIIETGSVTLGNGKTIDLYVYKYNESPAWEGSIDYLKRAVEFYSEQVGYYPYPQATVIKSPGGSGGGMEYPMLTTIDSDSNAQAVDHVITHEVGHNWFYGILASNERRFPWMDEGMNTFIDHKYNDVYYNTGAYDSQLPKFFDADTTKTLLEKGMVWQCKRGRNQSCSLHSDDYNSINYGFSAYEYPAWSFSYLENFLGEEMMIKCLHDYFETWKFKHPYPKDVKESFEKASGQDLSWFFDGVLKSDGYIDYTLSNVSKASAVVKNKGQLAVPVRLDFKKDGKWVDYQWVNIEDQNQVIKLARGDYDELAINGKDPYLDVNPQNNSKKLSGSNMPKPKLKILGSIDDPKKAEIFFLPLMGYNVHDGLMGGLGLYNTSFPQKWTRINANIGYGFNSKKWVGVGNFERDFILNSATFRKLMFAANYRKFSVFSPNVVSGTDLKPHYQRFSPSLTLYFEPYFTQQKEEWLKYSFIRVDKQLVDFTSPSPFIFNDVSNFHSLSFHRKSKKTLSPSYLVVELLYHQYQVVDLPMDRFLQLNLSMAGKLLYQEKSAFHYRIYAGFFPVNTNRRTKSYNNSIVKGTLNASYSSAADVTLEHYWLARQSFENFSGQEIKHQQGGFKNPRIYNIGSVGKSNNALFAVNLKSDIPVPLFRFLPIKPYLDLANYASPIDDGWKWNWVYDMGFALEWLDGAIGLYVPLLQSQNLDQALGGIPFARRISFSLDINKLKPWEFIDRFEL